MSDSIDHLIVTLAERLRVLGAEERSVYLDRLRHVVADAPQQDRRPRFKDRVDIDEEMLDWVVVTQEPPPSRGE